MAIPYSHSWLGMFSRKLDWFNLRMTIHCLAKLPILYRDFIRLVRSYRPNIIYAASHHDLILLWPVLAALRIPVVYHVHNPLPTAPFYRRSFAFWGRSVNHYIAVSQNVTNSISALGVRANQISLIYNGINVSRFRFIETRSDDFAIKYRWPRESVVIGMTGQMNEDKGHLDFLNAAHLLHRKHPEVRFVIGGKQEPGFYERLLKYVGENSLSEIVGFSGWQDDMTSFYAGIDVFVLPTREDTEGFGLVIAEAMATGLPVVATRSGGAAEVVEHGTTGFLVDRQEPTRLAVAISGLVTSPAKRKCMGRAGRQRVETIFDLSRQSLLLEKVLETAANTCGTRKVTLPTTP